MELARGAVLNIIIFSLIISVIYFALVFFFQVFLFLEKTLQKNPATLLIGYCIPSTFKNRMIHWFFKLAVSFFLSGF